MASARIRRPAAPAGVRSGSRTCPSSTPASRPRRRRRHRRLPRRSQREKYGGLFYLGIAGLLFMAVLVGWFGYGVWSNRDIWADVYAVHDASRPEADRIEAASRLAGNPRFADAPKMEISLRKDPPELARYVLAESISTEAVARDPRPTR